MSVKITFLGAAGTVTGSKYLVEAEQVAGRSRKVLVDAGVFQGDREWREKNWDDLDAGLLREIDCVLLTHAHIDHTGMLPRFTKLGLSCPVYCSAATAALSGLLLPDSAHLQEEDAAFRARRGRSRHKPPLPLYTAEDARSALSLFKPVPFGSPQRVFEGVEFELGRMGHILGAASITLRIGGRCIVFSGDVGRYSVPILRDPEPAPGGDMLLIESTYGNRRHKDADIAAELEKIINRTVRRGGKVLIPSFAVGRAQLLLYYIRELKEQRRIADIPVVIDSPTADDATEIYGRFTDDYDEEALGILRRGNRPFSFSKLRFTKSKDDSIKLNSVKEPMVIISASGMLSGGRVLHHLRHLIGDERNTVLFVGYQAAGGRGAWLIGGAATVRVFNEELPVRAEISELSSCSAHADQDELMRWINSNSSKPGRVCVVHGERESARVFADSLKETLRIDAVVPAYKETLSI